jgi:hypothetical protein
MSQPVGQDEKEFWRPRKQHIPRLNTKRNGNVRGNANIVDLG